MRHFTDFLGPTPDQAAADLVDAFELEEVQIRATLRIQPRLRKLMRTGRTVYKHMTIRRLHQRLRLERRYPPHSWATTVRMMDRMSGALQSLPFG